MDLKYKVDLGNGTNICSYHIDTASKKEVATVILVEEQGFDDKTARKIVIDVLFNYDLLDEFLEANEDFVKDYFHDEAMESWL